MHSSPVPVLGLELPLRKGQFYPFHYSKLHARSFSFQRSTRKFELLLAQSDFELNVSGTQQEGQQVQHGPHA